MQLPKWIAFVFSEPTSRTVNAENLPGQRGGQVVDEKGCGARKLKLRTNVRRSARGASQM